VDKAKESRSQGRIRLVVMRGASKDKAFFIEEGENLIGRWDPDAGAFPDVDLDAEDTDAKVSRKHAIIERRGDKLWVLDLGSRNGTFVNRGARLAPNEKHPVSIGDEIIIGKTFLVLQREADGAKEEA
jgi:pSer/pThr/pTyr-binding forkhead associated (FHA) protein